VLVILSVVMILGLRPAMAVGSASYDCSKADTSIAQFVCGDAELSRADLILWHPYYALRQQVGRAGRRNLSGL
jgi:uncharacterized protein